MALGAIILCGGESRRMGRDKATLPFGPGEVLLERVTRLLAEVVPSERIACVAAAGQVLPRLPAKVQIARDTYPDGGPLGGLATGLAAICDRADIVFACGCDAPLLSPAFVTRTCELLADHQIAAPDVGTRLHPLAAAYRADVLPIAESLLTAGERSLQSLLARCDTLHVPADEFRDVDPELASLASCNTFAEYQQALARAFPADLPT